jgi:hypothetical protein
MTAVADHEIIHQTGTLANAHGLQQKSLSHALLPRTLLYKPPDILSTKPLSIPERTESILLEFFEECAPSGWKYTRFAQFVWTSCEADPTQREALVILSHVLCTGEIYFFVMNIDRLGAGRRSKILCDLYVDRVKWESVEQRLRV